MTKIYIYGVVFYWLAILCLFWRVSYAMKNDPEFMMLASDIMSQGPSSNSAVLFIPGLVPVVHWMLGFAIMMICFTDEGWQMLLEKLAEYKDDDDLKK